MNNTLYEKLEHYFGQMIVKKDLRRTNSFKALGLQSFMRDWLIKKYADENGDYDMEKIQKFCEIYLPSADAWTRIKARLVDGEAVRLLAQIVVDIDIVTGEKKFTLPRYGLSKDETSIDDDVWSTCRESLTKSHEVWGQIELRYRTTERNKGRVYLSKFQDFCPYIVDVDYYKEVREHFTTEEWIDIILGAIDYNPDAYLSNNGKMAILKRLLPYVEKNINLIELAPKGTGKSYLFSHVSKYGWLAAGGVMTRAQLFYDLSKSRYGLIAAYDCIALDEIHKMKFPNPEEMQGALQGYLEDPRVSIGHASFIADAGLVILGNIPVDCMDPNERMIKYLPSVFNESALIDRFHGFIEGWEIPRMEENMKSKSWSLNTEYFSSIMHKLRFDGSYRYVVDSLVESYGVADTRHTEAVKRLATAWLKLLFPNVQSAKDISVDEFETYCFKPAFHMREIIYHQLCLMDREYTKTQMPSFRIVKP